MKKLKTLLFVSFLWLLLAASICFAQMYTITDLGTLPGGTSSSARGINERGQIIGESFTAGAPNAFLYSNGTMYDIGTFGGPGSHPLALNSKGDVVGFADLPGGYDTNFHAFLYSGGVLKDLGTLGGTNSQALAINNNLQIVGEAATSDGSHAFLYDNEMHDLGTFGGTRSYAQAINSAGQIAGTADTLEGYSHAFLYDGSLHDLGTLGGPISSAANGGLTDTGLIACNSMIADHNLHACLYDGSLHDLGTLGGTHSHAYGINASGVVIGYSETAGNGQVAGFYYDGVMHPLTLGGQSAEAFAINTSGQVVGVALTSGALSVEHAFVHRDGVMYDLNDLIPAGSGWQKLVNATGINDAGQIVGYGFLQNGQAHAFLLTPLIPYKAIVQPPINADGSSVFKAKRGAVPVKFTLTQNDAPTCTLPAATISVTRTAGGTLGLVPTNTYSTPADIGSNFRIDPTACQYIYNLAASSMGVGTYRVDISINGVFGGHAVFALQ